MSDRVIGYVRVSTNKQEVGPEVQIAQLEAEAASKGWDLTLIREDAASGASIAKRPLLSAALEDLQCKRYDGLAVTKLDRLTRSVADGSRLLVESQHQGWRIVCLDIGVDTSSIVGASMFHMLLTFAETERRFIGQRTKEAMAKVRQHKHVGRPRVYSEDTVLLAVQLRDQGMTLAGVAAELEAQGIPTASGSGCWTVARVQALLSSLTARGEYRAPAPLK